MSDTWQPPRQDQGLDLVVQQMADSMARPIAELTKLIGQLRAEANTLTDFLVFKGDTTVNGALETTARSVTDAFTMHGLLMISPTGTTAASVQIGELVFPVQDTTFKLDHLARIVNPQDRIRVTLTPDGPVTLYLWGTVIPIASL